jgi:hypothetical protein
VQVNVSCLTALANTLETLSAFTLFPNPTNGLLTIGCTLRKASVYHLQLMNMEGREVMLQTGNATAGEFKQSIELSQLPKGVYFVQLRVADEVISRKVVLQ